MLKRFILVLLLVAAIGLLVRSSFSPYRQGRLRIAMDPSWYPIQVVSKENNLNAFSRELLDTVAEESDFTFSLIRVSSEGLIRGLLNEEVDGILTAVQPTVVTEGRFLLSQSYFDLGPVLVVRADSELNGMTQLVGSLVGIQREASNYMAILSNGLVKVAPYDSLTLALDALLRRDVEAVLMPGLRAIAYAKGTYRGQIRLASDPLNNEGLRLVLPKGADPKVIEAFDQTLAEMKRDGRYDDLLKRWELP